MSHTILTIIFGLLLFPAVFMVLIPMMPAMSYMFGVTVLYGLIDRFEHLQFSELGILTGILVASLIIDWFAGVLGAKYAGASRKSLWYGFIGVIIGSLLFPPFGGIPGLFLAVFVTELSLNSSSASAVKAATGSLLGALSGVVVNMVLALVFFILFLVFAI